MLTFNIDTTISKTDMIIFEIEITYVSNLAHPWLKTNIKLRNQNCEKATKLNEMLLK